MRDFDGDPKDHWKMRRRMVIVTVLFCMAVISYILFIGLDTETAQTAVNMAFFIMGSTVSGYVFGAVWDHKRVNESPRRERREYRGRGEYS